jgi:hypothetical protein
VHVYLLRWSSLTGVLQVFPRGPNPLYPGTAVALLSALIFKSGKFRSKPASASLPSLGAAGAGMGEGAGTGGAAGSEGGGGGGGGGGGAEAPEEGALEVSLVILFPYLAYTLAVRTFNFKNIATHAVLLSFRCYDEVCFSCVYSRIAFPSWPLQPAAPSRLLFSSATLNC